MLKKKNAISIKRKLKEIREKEKVIDEMPTCLSHRFNKIMILGVVTCLAAVILGVISIADNSMFYQAALVFLGMGALLIGIALYFRWRVFHFGYMRIEGEVTLINNKILSPIKRNDKISSFHVTTIDKEIYQVPGLKEMEDLPLHSKLEVFFPSNAKFTEQNGVLYASTVWGYSVIEEPVLDDLIIKEKKSETD